MFYACSQSPMPLQNLLDYFGQMLISIIEARFVDGTKCKVCKRPHVLRHFFGHPSLVYINLNFRYCHSCLKDNSKVPFLHDLALLKVTFATSCQLSNLLFSSMRISNLRRERSSQSASQQSDQIWYFSSHFDSNKTRQGLHGCDSTHHWVRGEHRRVGLTGFTHSLPIPPARNFLISKMTDRQNFLL